MNSLSRPTALKIAAVISVLLAVVSVVGSLPFIFQGAASTESNPESIPFVVIMISFVTAVVAIVAAYGTWKGQRWGIVLTILANLINGLSAAPGILFAPTQGLFIAATVTVVLTILIIVLCLWPDRRMVTA